MNNKKYSDGEVESKLGGWGFHMLHNYDLQLSQWLLLSDQTRAIRDGLAQLQVKTRLELTSFWYSPICFIM